MMKTDLQYGIVMPRSLKRREPQSATWSQHQKDELEWFLGGIVIPVTMHACWLLALLNNASYSPLASMSEQEVEFWLC